MKTKFDLKNLLDRIDHKSYPAYKDTKGSYQFENFVLSIDKVQGDPFAAPSHISVRVTGGKNQFQKRFYEQKHRRIAIQDYILRRAEKYIRNDSFRARGSGKSGLISVRKPGQEILNRSSCQIDEKTGTITLRIEVGFPAKGRTIQAGELEKILFDFLPNCVEKSLFEASYKINELEEVTDLADDQQYIREHLGEKGLVAFLANGSVLPRKSGVSQEPMKEAIRFQSPSSMEVSFTLPHAGEIRGMGIERGVTLIVGGGYHGKSTVLQALELGVYNHVKGDGREFVITDDTAVKLRAEDGRSIQKVDISMFIRNLPNGKDTKSFSTENASGSTSQAANTIEAMEAGAHTFLIDEDTSATNFMVRDELMQSVVHREDEPIVPYIDRVRELYEVYGISTVLVAGSSGSYFEKADHIIQMYQYKPAEITDLAKEKAALFRKEKESAPEGAEQSVKPDFNRIIMRDDAFMKENRIKTKADGTDCIRVNKEEVDIRLIEQLVNNEQLMALAEILIYLKKKRFLGKDTLKDTVDSLYKDIEEQDFMAFCEREISGNLAIPRKQEIYAVLNRCRRVIQVK